jgi:hypothetical protein
LALPILATAGQSEFSISEELGRTKKRKVGTRKAEVLF